MNYKGITFIYSHIEVEGDQSFELIPGHTFRKAHTKEIENIRKLLNKYSEHPIQGWGVPYEYIIKEIRKGSGTEFQRKRLPKKDWKYWVIAFKKSNAEIHNLQYAAILLENELDFAFTIFFMSPKGVGYSSMPSWLRDRSASSKDTTTNAQKIKSKEIKLIKEYYIKQKAVAQTYPFIDHAIKNFFALRAIPPRSELIIVGYFSIIESLIAHAPRLTETLDSIRHQIYNKMILIRKKFKRQVRYKTYFLHAKENSIWKMLYDYRSCLAHGGVPDFKSKFQILQNHNNVSNFLKENIKETILLAMKEPEFIKDLKEC